MKKALYRFCLTPVLALALLAGLAGTAQAHPHVWVVVKSVIVFDKGGRVTHIRHSWTFDEMYSAFAIQGLGGRGRDLQKDLDELASVNVKQLAESEFFTFVRAAGQRQEFGAPRNASITLDDKKLATLHFDVPLKKPAAANKAFVLQVFDPGYFVAFEFEKGESVTMTGAPKGCSLRKVTPAPLSDADMLKLQQVSGTDVSPGVNFGMKLSTRVFVACP
ncbi:MAG: DUF1007 family protein [Alphaproteobacteria bacterium]|nr:DUF1007 family protein [Alphaproteobacteria bacterium]